MKVYLKLAKDHLREIVAFVIVLVALVGFIHLLGKPIVKEHPIFGLFASVLATFLGGVLKFVAVSVLGWGGTAVVTREVALHVWGTEYDVWWQTLDKGPKSLISLGIIAVNLIVAALCMLDITVNVIRQVG